MTIHKDEAASIVKNPPDPHRWVDDYADYLYNYAMARLRDEEQARDLVQETFLAALGKLENFEGRSSERTWLTGILKHKIIDVYCKKSPGPFLSSEIHGRENFFRAEDGHWEDTTKIVNGVPLKSEDISPLLTGENIPQVKLPDAHGQPFDLSAAVAAKPTILIFYRGGWCPFCSKQLAGLQEIEGDLVKMGYQLLAISTDSPDNLQQVGRENFDLPGHGYFPIPQNEINTNPAIHQNPNW